jgi:hypothetical protein
MWAFGAGTHGELLRKTRGYTLRGVAQQISCPVLVLEAQNECDLPRRGARLTGALTCAQRHIPFTDAEGAGEHCPERAMLAFHRHAFDWIDTVLTRCADGRN